MNSEQERARDRGGLEQDAEIFRYAGDWPLLSEMDADDLRSLMAAFADKHALSRIKEELEAACSAVCPDCARGNSIKVDAKGYYHENGALGLTRYTCRAAAIRARMKELGL